ncbi:MAG: hypothetical protein IPP32_13075 [Bacteroidetes bacterium]|nr:hypothetical protein [Bacteroidota bacterium]
MEKLISYKLTDWIFKDFQYFCDLIEFEGPVLVHYLEKKTNRHALYYWVEGDSKVNRWLCFEISEKQLHDYLYQYISLFDLIKKKESGYFFTTDIDIKFNYGNFQMIPCYALPEKYLPLKESFYIEDVDSRYDGFFNFKGLDFYRDALQKESFDLIIAPIKKTYNGMVTVSGGADFLKNFENSFKAFEIVKASKELKDILSPVNFDKTIKSIVDSTPPLISDNAPSSFKISISTAPEMKGESEGYSPQIEKFRNNVLNDYKDEILGIDLNNEEQVQKIVSNYEEFSRAKIFEPLIKIINSTDYELTYVDKKKNLKTKYKKIDYDSIVRLAPKKLKTKPEESLEKAFLTITVAVDPNKNYSAISVKELLQVTLFSKIEQEASTELETISGEEFSVILGEPIKVDYKHHDGEFYISYKPLNIEVNHRENKEALKLFKALFIYKVKVDYMAKIPSNKENRKFFESIIKEILNKEDEE